MAVNRRVRALQITPPPIAAVQPRKDFICMRVGHLHPPRCSFHCEYCVNPRRGGQTEAPPQERASSALGWDSASVRLSRLYASKEDGGGARVLTGLGRNHQLWTPQPWRVLRVSQQQLRGHARRAAFPLLFIAARKLLLAPT